MTNHTASFISIPQTRRSATPAAPETARGQLEVNVIFTSTRATAAALKYAGSLARDLGATIRLRAAIVVPLRLPLNEPQISVAFARNMLAELISKPDARGTEHTVDLYVCRDWSATLAQLLDVNAPVVIGRSHRWWPGPESSLVKELRSRGFRVIVADRNALAAPNKAQEFAAANKG